MKVYIAGKITGDPEYKAKFKVAANKLATMGNIVLNPADLPAGMSLADYMRNCLSMIDSADIVVFLPDWKDSGGAVIEHMLCEYTKKVFAEYDDLVVGGRSGG